MKRGYTKAWRRELDSLIWIMPPLYLKVWYWLRHKVQHEQYLFPTHKAMGIWVLPGQRLTSLQEIAEGVKWCEWGREIIPNKKTIKTVLDWMVSEGMIALESNGKGTIISIINWDTYNHVIIGESNGQETARKRPADTSKECKECKECKEGKEENLTPPPQDRMTPREAAQLLRDYSGLLVVGGGDWTILQDICKTYSPEFIKESFQVASASKPTKFLPYLLTVLKGDNRRSSPPKHKTDYAALIAEYEAEHGGTSGS